MSFRKIIIFYVNTPNSQQVKIVSRNRPINHRLPITHITIKIKVFNLVKSDKLSSTQQNFKQNKNDSR